MAVQVITYKNSAEIIRIDKSAYLSNRQDMTNNVKFEGSQNILSPTFYITSVTEPTFNYVHIPEFNRYYFVSSKQWVSQNMWFITLDVDVLFSHKDAILTLTGVASRLEDQGGHSMIIDDFITVETTQEEDVNYTDFTITTGKKGFNIQNVDVDSADFPKHNMVFTCFSGNPVLTQGLITLKFYNENNVEVPVIPTFNRDVYSYTLEDTRSEQYRLSYTAMDSVIRVTIVGPNGTQTYAGPSATSSPITLNTGANIITVRAMLDFGVEDVYTFYINKL